MGHMSVRDSEPVKTTCPYCGVGCGVAVSPNAAGGVAVAGDPAHPANFGRLCSKGSALAETLAPDTRLLHPEIDGARVSWDGALDHVAAELSRIRATHGPGSIAFYLSGQLLTEDYYVANKFAKGFVGTPHVDTNSRLCMASSVAGHKRAFGADVVPGNYEDLDLADVVVLVGSNAAWCHPILYQRLQKARTERGAYVVTIDPRRTATSEGADLHLAIRPGSDVALWNGLLVWIAEHDALDRDYVAAHTSGLDAALASARETMPTISAVARATGLAERDIAAFYDLWCRTSRVVSCYSQGVNQAAQGTDKVNAIINCHLATGRIGKPGLGPFSLTGQPNAMGGREVGGLANALAAHMMFSERERKLVARFWQAPNLVTGEGHKAVQMFDAIARGEIKALWVLGTNPAVSLPRADAVRDALSKLELCVVSDVVARTDTMAGAHVRLPAHGWGEKDGTVTNSERRISRQRAFVPPVAEARADWWILSRVAERMGYGAAFPYRSVVEIFREHAALSGFENAGERAFDISGIADISAEAYRDLTPVQWPIRAGGTRGTDRMFADGRFATADGRGRFIAVAPLTVETRDGAALPFVLNSGRIRDQWHTMTRTGLAARLSAHIAEPYVEIHPHDARDAGIAADGLVRIENANGTAVVRATVTEAVQPGTLFVPIHWSAENASAGRIGALVHATTDPISGQPDAKATRVRLAALAAQHFGFVLSQDVPRIPDDPAVVYWARARIAHGTLTAFALDCGFAHARLIADRLLGQPATAAFEDAGRGQYRAAVIGDAVHAAVFLGCEAGLVPSAWLKTLIGRRDASALEKRHVLAGTAPGAIEDCGPIVCVCHQVGSTTIAQAVADGCADAAAVGRACRAGTNCGSCLPEINRMLTAADASRNPAARSLPDVELVPI